MTSRPLDILEFMAPAPALRSTLERIITTMKGTPKDWREWRGANGTWIFDDAKKHGQGLNTNVSYNGPTTDTLNAEFADALGSVSIRMPMHKTINDDGPSIASHVIDMARIMLAAIEGKDTASGKRIGLDPTPWLIATAVLGKNYGEVGSVEIPTPWMPASFKDDDGRAIDMAPGKFSHFSAAAPTGLRVQDELTSHAVPRASVADFNVDYNPNQCRGNRVLRIQPIGDLLFSADSVSDPARDPIATFRALTIAKAAGAFKKDRGEA